MKFNVNYGVVQTFEIKNWQPLNSNYRSMDLVLPPQESRGKEFSKILFENLHSLYKTDNE